MIKISVVTVVYNGEKYIEEAIKTVLQQNYQNIEFIIIDGKSQDKTLDIINKYRNRIDVLISEEDKGIYDAMNKGIAHATGDAIIFHNVGDYYCRNDVFKKIAQVLEDENVDSCYGDLLFIRNEPKGRVVRVWRGERYHPRKLALGWMPPPATFCIKSKIYKKYGNFVSDLSISADYELTLRCFGKHRITTKYIPEFMVKMRVGGKSTNGLPSYLTTLKEDYLSWVRNWPQKRAVSVFSVVYKKIHKIPQFFIRAKNK